MNRQSDNVFWERLQSMPMVEAEAECVSRHEYGLLSIAVLQGAHSRSVGKERAAIGVEMSYLMAQLSMLKTRTKFYRKLFDETRWSNAVLQVLGREAWEACKDWKVKTEVEKLQNND